MAASKNNKNALGNPGAKFWGKDNREKAATLKGLVIDWAIKVMKVKETEKNKKDKELVISKILPNCVPREMDLGNREDAPFKLEIEKIGEFLKNLAKK